jgi:glyoxylase I family protein
MSFFMRIEHVALNVTDPVAFAAWYVKNLGMKVVRKLDAAPFTHFLADEGGRTLLEVYKQTAPVPDYAAQDPMVLHIAFSTNDVEAERARLLAAGAKPAGDVTRTPAGDVMTFVRDPWGIVVQFVSRAVPLVAE